MSQDLKAKCDIEFISVFPAWKEKITRMPSKVFQRLFNPNMELQYKYKLDLLPRTQNSTRRIWLTGENLRPPLGATFDGFLSFDQKYISKNAYCPLWYFDVGFFKPTFLPRVGVTSSIDSLSQQREIQNVPSKFSCIFAGNPHPSRLHFANLLGKYGEVEKFGVIFGNTVKEKYPIASQFRFTIAFENDLYPGYVTEKILEAYLCGSIPIYWGLLGENSPINENAIIQKLPEESFEQLAERIANMSENEILHRLNQKLFNFVPDISSILRVILGK